MAARDSTSIGGVSDMAAAGHRPATIPGQRGHRARPLEAVGGGWRGASSMGASRPHSSCTRAALLPGGWL